MEYYSDPTFCERILGYARKIATYAGHRVDEVHGLQDAATLAQKRMAEIAELRQSLLEKKDRVWVISELADIAYYSLCLNVAAPLNSRDDWYVDALRIAHLYGVEQEEVEAALDAKYGLRASRPNRKKDETPEERAARFQQENDAIQTALDKIVWPGLAVQDIVNSYGIPEQTVYSAIRNGRIESRQTGGGRGNILIKMDPKTRAWIARQRFEQIKKSSK